MYRSREHRYYECVCCESGSLSLKEADPELFKIIKNEEERQRCGLELIASEVCFEMFYSVCQLWDLKYT